MVNLSKYITESEFIKTDVRGVDNSLPDKYRNNAIRICKIADIIRDYYGKPYIVSSGYRSPAVNAKVGGSATSNHSQANALDSRVLGVSNFQLFNDISEGRIKDEKGNPIMLLLDELILEFCDDAEGENGWVHVASRDVPRHKKLRAKSISGKTVYSDLVSVAYPPNFILVKPFLVTPVPVSPVSIPPTSIPKTTIGFDTYTVKSGDTLSGIANQFKDRYSTTDNQVVLNYLISDNGIKNTNVLSLGQKLKIRSKFNNGIVSSILNMFKK